MSEDIKNLADPEFEPTDADLIGLSERAFANVRETRETALEALRARITVARSDALRALEERLATTREKT